MTSVETYLAMATVRRFDERYVARMTREAEGASAALSEEGIEAAVVDPRWLSLPDAAAGRVVAL